MNQHVVEFNNIQVKLKTVNRASSRDKRHYEELLAILQQQVLARQRCVAQKIAQFETDFMPRVQQCQPKNLYILNL